MFEDGSIPVAEDSVEYHLYFKNLDNLPLLQQACNAFVKTLIGDYMWQVGVKCGQTDMSRRNHFICLPRMMKYPTSLDSHGLEIT